MLKALEKRWKALWLRVICALLGRRAPVGRPDWTAGPRRVLFLRPDRIGDAIVSTGLLRAIAEVSPQLRIDVLASPANEQIVRRIPWVDAVHVYDKRRPRSFPGLLRRLRASRYDAVVDCMVTAPSMTGVLLMLGSGAPYRVGVAGRGVDAALTLPVPGTPGGVHIIDLLFALGTAFDIPQDADRQPALSVSDAERSWAEEAWARATTSSSRRLLVNVSAGRGGRMWPDQRFVAVLRALRPERDELGVAVMGAPAEWQRVAGIAAAAGVAAVATPELGQAIALVAAADFVFTPDTSIAHMASAFRKPAVVLYLHGAAGQWGLYGTAGSGIESREQTLAAIPAAAVISALDSLLQRDSLSPSGIGSV